MYSNYKSILEGISNGSITLDEIYKIKNINILFEDTLKVEKDIKNILEQKYLKEKEGLDELNLSSLTTKYHKEIDAFSELFDRIQESKKIRNLDVETLEHFLEKDYAIKMIEKFPSWYKDDNGDVAILSRMILESNYRDRVDDRRREMEWEEFTRTISNIFDKIGTKKDVSKIYDSLDVDSKLKKISLDDYKYNIQKIVDKIDAQEVNLDDVLVLVAYNLNCNSSYKNSIIELFTSSKGAEIFEFIERNGTKEQRKEFEAYRNYLLHNDKNEKLEAYHLTNMIGTLIEVRNDYYEDTHSSIFLNEKDVIDISKLIELGTRISSNEFEGNFNHCGTCIVNDKPKDFIGIYYDEENDTVKILVRNFSDESKIQAYEIDRDEFVKEAKELINNEFENKEILKRVCDKSTTVGKRFIRDEFEREIIIEKEEIEL